MFTLVEQTDDDTCSDDETKIFLTTKPIQSKLTNKSYIPKFQSSSDNKCISSGNIKCLKTIPIIKITILFMIACGLIITQCILIQQSTPYQVDPAVIRGMAVVAVFAPTVILSAELMLLMYCFPVTFDDRIEKVVFMLVIPIPALQILLPGLFDFFTRRPFTMFAPTIFGVALTIIIFCGWKGKKYIKEETKKVNENYQRYLWNKTGYYRRIWNRNLNKDERFDYVLSNMVRNNVNQYVFVVDIEQIIYDYIF